MATAVTTIIAPKAMSRMLPGVNSASRPPPYAPVIPARPNSSPVRQRTRPALAWETTPAALVTPTTNREVAMACLASSPAR
jgi:hypothetical protein